METFSHVIHKLVIKVGTFSHAITKVTKTE